MEPKKIQALLFDLDDTLLINDMETFGQQYFKALMAKVQRFCSLQVFLPALEAATRAMWYNDGQDGTNAEVFAREFFGRVGCKPEELMPIFDEFYTREFEGLRQYTSVDPDARPLVQLAFACGYQVAIATQPMFPLSAIRARLRWAEVGAEEFPYDYITSYEVMSACKPHPHYFATLVERLGRRPEECLMVGDSVESDMAAGRYGLKTFWVMRAPQAQVLTINAQGALRDLMMLIETGRINEL